MPIHLSAGSRSERDRGENRLGVTAEFWSVITPMIEQARRQYTRKTLNPLPYINLPSGNGGLVLDISEQGLRFRAFAALEPSGPIPFSFTSDSNLIVGTGELVWFDQVKKTGGLRFTQLPYDALEQIRKLPENSSLRPDISKDLTLHIPAPEEPPSWNAKVRGAVAVLQSKMTVVIDKLLPEALRAKARALAPRMSLQKRNRWMFNAAYGLILAFVVSSVVYARHREAGELLIRLGTRLSGGVSTVKAASTIDSPSASVAEASVNRSQADVLPAPALPPPQAISQPGPQTVSPPVVHSISQPVTVDAAKIAQEKSAPTAAPRIQETAARSPKPEAPARKLVVQVAAVKAEADARVLTNTLRQKNFEAFVGTLPVDSLYRVMLGPYADQASARVVLDKLKKAGFNSFIRREAGAERLGS
jgi:cell division septation protein DedD